MPSSVPDWTAARRNTRYKADVRLKVGAFRGDQKAYVFGQGNDVSEDGMAAYVPSEFEVGEVLEIEMRLPYAKRAITLKAVVRNRNGFRYGLEYAVVDAADRAEIQRSLKTLELMQ